MRINTSAIVPHIAAIVIFLWLPLFAFSPQFSGKVVGQSDIISYRGMSQELREYKARTGQDALWTNSMFGGMPSYQINTVTEGNYVKVGKSSPLIHEATSRAIHRCHDQLFIC
ncbi:MAG: hypothetical protein R2795_16495 [Saprospiraceae bacterium]